MAILLNLLVKKMNNDSVQDHIERHFLIQRDTSRLELSTLGTRCENRKSFIYRQYTATLGVLKMIAFILHKQTRVLLDNIRMACFHYA